MLTPQEVSQRSFGKASFNGYNMAMVDDFLDEVTKDYEALYNDNALLKQKLGVLSNKIREYQSTEEAMRKTLLAAQQMADNMVKEAEAKRDALLAQAEEDALQRLDDVRRTLINEEGRLEAAKSATAAYQSRVREICQQQLDYLLEIDHIAPRPRRQAEEQVTAAADDIEAAVLQAVADEMPHIAETPVMHEAPRHGPAQEEPQVAESSVSLYEQLMAERGQAAPATDAVPADHDESARRYDKFNIADNFGGNFDLQ